MQETSQNLETLNKRIKELENNNCDLNLKNEVSLKKQDELQRQVNDFNKLNVDDGKKYKDEAGKLRDKVDKLETQKVMIEKKLTKVEKELKEY